nr:hypothetical protein [Tanacetum cinerariifolium]
MDREILMVFSAHGWFFWE